MDVSSLLAGITIGAVVSALFFGAVLSALVRQVAARIEEIRDYLKAWKNAAAPDPRAPSPADALIREAEKKVEEAARKRRTMWDISYKDDTLNKIEGD